MELFSSYQQAFQSCMETGRFAAARLFHLDKRLSIDSTGCHKVFLTLTGDKLFHLNDRICEVQPDQLFLVNAGTWHFFSHFDDSLPHPRYVIFISPEYLRQSSSAQTDLSACFSRSRSLLLSEGDRDRLVHLLDRLAGTGEYGSDLLDHSAFLQIMVFLNRLSAGQPQNPMPVSDKTVRALLEHLNRHLAEELTIEQLAEHFFLSPSHLCKRFRKAAGTTIHQYLTAQRIARAKELLTLGYPILEVSAMCGFREYQTFLKAFRREVGMTPSRYACFSNK